MDRESSRNDWPDGSVDNYDYVYDCVDPTTELKEEPIDKPVRRNWTYFDKCTRCKIVDSRCRVTVHLQRRLQRYT